MRRSSLLNYTYFNLFDNRGASTSQQSQFATLGPPPGFKTNHKRYISKDRVLLKLLENSLKDPNRATRAHASKLLRQHFAGRATALLVPLNRYLTSLIPTPATSPVPPTTVPIQAGAVKTEEVPRSAQQRMAPFHASKLLESLKQNGTPGLPFRSSSKQQEFYERWMRTNTFSAWLMREEEIVNGVLAERQMQLNQE